MVLFGFQLKDLKVVLQFCHETQIKIEMKVKKKVAFTDSFAK